MSSNEPTRYSVGAELVVYSDDIAGTYMDAADVLEWMEAEREKVRADERERAAERVAALRLWDYCYDHDCRMQAGAVAAIRGGGA